MKKFLIYCLVALMLVSSVSVVASAAASDWTKGNGFHVYQAADPASPKTTAGRVQVEQNSPVTIADAAGEYGVSVAHKGYYESGDNWGGVVSKEKLGLNGLEVTVNFEEVPVVDGSDDCWIAMDLVSEARSFRTNDPYNSGFINLIRFGRPSVELYGATGWGGIGSSGINGSEFAVKSGDTLKLSVKYELGQYIMTFAHNDDATYEVPADLTLAASDEVFTDGTAHVLVMASCFGLDKSFKYTVNVKPGAALTEEEIANKEFEKSKAVNVTVAKGAVEDITYILEDAKEEAGDNTATEVVDSIATIESALAAAEAAVETALNAATLEEAEAAAVAANAAKGDADAAFDALEAFIELFGEDATAEEAPTEDAPVEEAPDAEAPSVVDDAEEGGFPVWVIIVIAVVVVVVVVVVVLASKKKKN